MHRMIKQSIFITALLGTACFVLAQPAFAAPQVKGDYFSSHASSPVKDAQDGNFPAYWFQHFDDLVSSHQLTAEERAILTQPVNGSAERLRRWTLTAQRVAQRYRDFAVKLKALNVPNRWAGIRDFRDLTIDWYGDAASIYEDLIRPRPPAKTQEELQAMFDQFKERSKSVAQSNVNLHQLDLALRQQYSVPVALQDNPVEQFVRSK